MNIVKFNKISLAALLLASMALVMLPGCSSTEEAPAPDTGTTPTGDDGIPCEIDMMQPGCTKEDVDL
jgi:outer membrane protein assembly factor BamE (lipoprotein component of BamABCDE complex)